MKKRLLAVVCILAMATSLVACGSNGTSAGAKKETFSATHEVKGTTSKGEPKNDTFIFEGETEDGVITKLNFDIIRNKGLEGEYSKKDIMGYMMNVSDAEIVKTENGFDLVKFDTYGFSSDYAEGADGQYMVKGSLENVTEETAIKDVKIVNMITGETLPIEKVLAAYAGLAKEAGVEEFTADTLVKDLIAPHGLYKDNAFVEGSKRVSFDGENGGRSYGEQIDAIVKHILDNKMTLEDAYTLLTTENQGNTSIADRDAVSGATIAFVGDFGRTVYQAIHGEVFQGVISHKVVEGTTVVTTSTQGYAGEVKANVSFDADGKVIAVDVTSSEETPDIGGKLTAENSDFIKSVIDAQGEVDVVGGATKTSDALNKAVKTAMDYFKTIK